MGLGQLKHHSGFHSQPPNYTDINNKPTQKGDEDISFHYVDVRHQRSGGKKGQYKCNAKLHSGANECHGMYRELFRKYYGEQAWRESKLELPGWPDWGPGGGGVGEERGEG